MRIWHIPESFDGGISLFCDSFGVRLARGSLRRMLLFTIQEKPEEESLFCEITTLSEVR